MTMTDPTPTRKAPPIPAELMEDQPISEEALDLLAELAAAFPGSVTELAEAAAAVPEEELGANPADPATPAEVALRTRAPEVARFRVTDRGAAEWALRKLAAIEAERAERREMAEAWKRDVDRWLDGELRALDPKAAFFEGHLHAYMLDVRAESGDKIKSVKLTGGALKSSGSTTPKPAIADQAAVLEWAKGLPAELLASDATPIKTTEEVQISRLAKLVELREVVEYGEDADGQPVETRRYSVVVPVAVPADADPLDYAVPGTTTKVQGISSRIELA